jgi:CHAD domain-containing protein
VQHTAITGSLQSERAKQRNNWCTWHINDLFPLAEERVQETMAFHFKRDDPSVQDSVRRIARSQFGSAMEEIGDSDLDRSEAVHQVRKRCKKLRGLIRLVRPAFEDYAAENAFLRDLARSISHVRDADVRLETYDKVMTAFADQVERPAFTSIERQLLARKASAVDGSDIEERLSDIGHQIATAAERAEDWAIDGDGFELVGDRLMKTYKRARKSLEACHRKPTPERLHEWRKRVKYHWYHTRLLRELWPVQLRCHAEAADALGDMLGDHHDLAVLHALIIKEPETFGRTDTVHAFLGLLEQRQNELTADIFPLGFRLFAETPRAFRKRWQAYWKIWRSNDTHFKFSA